MVEAMAMSRRPLGWPSGRCREGKGNQLSVKLREATPLPRQPLMRPSFSGGDMTLVWP